MAAFSQKNKGDFNWDPIPYDEVGLSLLSPFLSGLNFIHWTYLLFRLVESRRGRQTAYLALPLLIKVYS